MSGRDATWGNIYGFCDFNLIFNFFLFFSYTAHTRESTFAHNCSKDAVLCEENPFGYEQCLVVKFGVFYSKITSKMGRNRQLPAKIKYRKTSKLYKRYAKYVNKPWLWNWGRSFGFRQQNLAEKSRWRHIWLAIKPRYLGNHASQIQSCYGTLSGSLGERLGV